MAGRWTTNLDHGDTHMAEPPVYTDTGNDTGTPRRVKVFGTIFPTYRRICV
jgi:hypothetical protein